MDIAVLITCYNRRESTVGCLQSLFDQKIPKTVRLSAFLVDDDSSDGTSQAIAHAYPQVRLIQGSGNLYWNQGMRLAWETAVSKGPWDAYLWLNDDTHLLPGSLKCMLSTLSEQINCTGRAGIVVGSCKSPSSLDALTYGGQIDGVLVPPGDEPKPVTSFNGNLVLISHDAHTNLGNLSPHYHHSFGDIDYGIRASKAGVPIWLAPGFLADCPRNPIAKWRNPDVSFWERWRAVRTPKGWSVRELKAFAQVRGKRWWILSVLRQAAMVCFPSYAIRYQKKFSQND